MLANRVFVEPEITENEHWMVATKMIADVLPVAKQTLAEITQIADV